MIVITLYQFVLIYAGVLLLSAAGLWLWTELRLHRRREELGRQFRWRCAFCGFVYLDDASDRHSECPQCHSINMPEGLAVELPRGQEGPRRNPSRKKGRSMR